jgi:hypothetical protein
MPAPTLSGPREDPEASMKTASVQKPSLFGGVFDRTTTQSTDQSTNQVASAGSESFFSRLFKPKSDAAAQPAPQGTALAGLKPAPEPRKAETAKLETPKSEPQKLETQKTEAPAAAASRSSAPVPQVANAAPPATLIKGAQPLVPTGSFDGRWAGLQ